MTGPAQVRARTKELAVVLHGLPVQRVQHGMASAVGRAGASVRLTALSKVQGLAAERALVDLALGRPGEGQAVILQLNDRLGGLAAHVLDGILVGQQKGSVIRVTNYCRRYLGRSRSDLTMT
jgi:signal transduction histidine kinase